jgi:hypothetical protein
MIGTGAANKLTNYSAPKNLTKELVLEQKCPWHIIPISKEIKSLF